MADAAENFTSRSSENIAPLLNMEAERARVVRLLDGYGIARRLTRDNQAKQFLAEKPDKKVIFLTRDKDHKKAEGKPEEREEIRALLSETEQHLKMGIVTPDYDVTGQFFAPLQKKNINLTEVRNDPLYHDKATDEEINFIASLRRFRIVDAGGRKLDEESRQALYKAHQIGLEIQKHFPYLRSLEGFLEGHSTTVGIVMGLAADDLNHQEGKILIEPWQAVLAGYFHDTGKLERGIGNAIRKPGEFNSKEYEVVKLHTVIGESVLDALVKKHPGFQQFDEETIRLILDAAKYHHERVDGKGYAGAGAPEIPMVAQMLSPIDANDAICYKRSYDHRTGDKNKLAREILTKCSGSQFSKRMVQLLLEMNIKLIDHRVLREMQRKEKMHS